LRRQGLKPKNHHQDNIKYLRELQKKNLDRTVLSESAEPFKMSRFKNVESQVRRTLDDWSLREDSGDRSHQSRPASSRDFTRKGVGAAKFEELSKLKLEEARKMKGEHDKHTSRKPPIPKPEECGDIFSRGSKEYVDFLRKNAVAVIKSMPGGQAGERSLTSQASDRKVIVSRLD
jgi:hypothetical protein